MNRRRLGNSDIVTPPLMLGGNVFGWTCDEATSFAILDRFLDAGFNFIDTANVYSNWVSGHSGGESETILGNWMQARGNRSKVIIATKVGYEMSPERKGLKAAAIKSEVEESLQRLQTDCIDLYQSHVDDPETPVEETLSAYADLIRAGKVRFIGASNFSPERLIESRAVAIKNGLPLYQSLQPKYSLYDREEVESKLMPVCQTQNLGLIPYQALARGFFTGKYRTEADLAQSPRGKGVKQYMDERGMRILAALDVVAGEVDANTGQVALAWAMAQPGMTAPIASATSIAQLDNLIAATRLTLTSGQITRLNEASAC